MLIGAIAQREETLTSDEDRLLLDGAGYPDLDS